MLRVSQGLLQSLLSGPLAHTGWTHSWVGAFQGAETPFPPPCHNEVLSCSFDLPGCSLVPEPFARRLHIRVIWVVEQGSPGVGAVGVSGLTCSVLGEAGGEELASKS